MFSLSVLNESASSNTIQTLDFYSNDLVYWILIAAHDYGHICHLSSTLRSEKTMDAWRGKLLKFNKVANPSWNNSHFPMCLNKNPNPSQLVPTIPIHESVFHSSSSLGGTKTFYLPVIYNYVYVFLVSEPRTLYREKLSCYPSCDERNRHMSNSMNCAIKNKYIQVKLVDKDYTLTILHPNSTHFNSEI